MSRYALGIDVGARTVTAAVCAVAGGEARPLERRGPGLEDLLRDLPVQRALTRVGDPTPLYGGAAPRSGAEVLAVAIARVRRSAESAEGEAPARTVVAVPPSWGEYRRGELAAALADTVGEDCTVASSAVAATRHHRATAGVAGAGTVAVYDLGAGTVDTAVVRATDDGALEHAAVPPEPCPWGGRDVDDAVLEHVRTAAGLPESPTTPGARAHLAALRTACVAAKEQLSTEPSVRVEVDGPDSPGSVRLVRSDVDELIAASVAASVTVMRAAVTDAGLRPRDLDGIVLAGGGVLVPLVAETLSAELEVPLLVDDRPELTVACGAAELAADLMTAAPAAPVDTVADEDDEDADEDAVVVDLATSRLMTAAQRAALRMGIVAALLITLLVTPLSLMGVLDGGVDARSAPDVAEAEEAPAAPAEAPAESTDAGPASTAGTGSGSGASSTSGSRSREKDRSTSAASTTPRATPGTTAGATTGAAPAPTAGPTVANTPTATTPPATSPPATTPPATSPPATTPPATSPPATTPPATTPPPPTSEAPAPTPVTTADAGPSETQANPQEEIPGEIPTGAETTA